GRIAVPPRVTAQYPADLGLAKPRPVLETASPQETPPITLQDCHHAVAALAPFALSEAYSLFRRRMIEVAHEPRHVGVAAKRDEVVEIRQLDRPQHQPGRLEELSRSVLCGGVGSARGRGDWTVGEVLYRGPSW